MVSDVLHATVIPEGEIAGLLSEVQEAFAEVSLGCYPSLSRFRAGGYPTKLVFSASSPDIIEKALRMLARKVELFVDDGVDEAKNDPLPPTEESSR